MSLRHLNNSQQDCELVLLNQCSDRKGPPSPDKNVQNSHRTFARTEKLIQQEIIRALAERNISTRVADVCRQAKVSQPTFYSHHKNCNEALSSGEDKLMNEFRRRIEQLKNPTSAEIFTALLVFIERHRNYFSACITSHNLHLLTRVLSYLRTYLTRNGRISAKSYFFYASNLLTILLWWGGQENFSRDLIPECVQDLVKVKPCWQQ